LASAHDPQSGGPEMSMQQSLPKAFIPLKKFEGESFSPPANTDPSTRHLFFASGGAEP